MDRFLELTEKAEFPYISCNFNKEGNLVFEPYVIKEVNGQKIAFVGVTTPDTITSSTPKFFMNDKKEFIYRFMGDEDGTALYEAVQKAVDDARQEGADLVYVMAHLGNSEKDAPWTYADVIANTSEIDVFLDGHSHDTEQVIMKNKDGKDVIRSAVGTKLNCIGYSYISVDGEILKTDIWSWANTISAPELLGIENSATSAVNRINKDLEEYMSTVIGTMDTSLTINDPVAIDASQNPVRLIRRQETNMGDFTTDAFLYQTGADIAILGGGGIRTSLEPSDITYSDIFSIFPFGLKMCVIEATGQQILDALEWGAESIPDENGGFLQVAGMSYEIDISIPTPCKANSDNMMVSIEGERRVKNVKINGEPINPSKTYTIASTDYAVLDGGDGNTALMDCKVIVEPEKMDTDILIDYISKTLNGKIPDTYSNPYGQGRITILNAE